MLDKTKALSSTLPGHDHKCNKHYDTTFMQLGSLQDICQLYNKYSLELGSVIDDWIIRTSIPFNNQRAAKGGKKGNR